MRHRPTVLASSAAGVTVAPALHRRSLDATVHALQVLELKEAQCNLLLRIRSPLIQGLLWRLALAHVNWSSSRRRRRAARLI